MSGTLKEEHYNLRYHRLPRIIVALNCCRLGGELRFRGLQHGSLRLEKIYDWVIVIVDSPRRLLVFVVEASILQSRRGIHILVVRLTISEKLFLIAYRHFY